MTKRGPLNKAEVFYIEQNPEKKSAEELANELSRNIGQIRKVMEKTVKKSKKATQITQTRKTMVDTLIGKKERNEQIVATVMTPAASQYLDENRQQLKSTKHIDAIHKPRG